jgi:iron-sulfur cluster protein
MAFPEAARKALTDEQLRANLRRATHTIRDKRARVVAELPEWEELREAAKAIKTETMARLPELLAQFEQRATARGAQVHRARTAREACRLVSKLAHGAKEVVKVKSMATQEIELNEALAAHGIRAVETDLAELIVQLAEDKPSHILVPAIHYNRTQIRDLFLKKIPGAPADLTDDPATLAGLARAHLRQKFLTATTAISGANFAIAETGTLVVVESEGNGRMCLTLPQTLITVVGIEKLLPRFADLGVFMKLLPRSSTGERMNPYTSMWTGVTPGDGPQTVHIVLLDNGRSKLLADPVGRQALHCIRCSACLNVCPVYERAGGHAYESVYPGPIGAILAPQLTGKRRDLPYASTLCGACYDVCPVKINIPEVLIHLRKPSGLSERVPMRAVSAVMRRPRRYASALRWARRLMWVPRFIPKLAGPWSRARDLPRAPRHTFRDWWLRQDFGHAAAGRSPESSPASSAAPAAETPVGQAPRHDAAPAEPPGGGLPPAQTMVLLAPSRDELVARFAERVGDYKATVRVCDEADLVAAVGELVRDTRVLVRPEEAPRAGLDEPGVSVLTGCALAIAETGTIILDAGPDQGRRELTLVPDHHVCIVRAEQIVPDVQDAVSRLADPTRPLTWISGPSATSDIELDRVEGVHGPRRLDVVIVR